MTDTAPPPLTDQQLEEIEQDAKFCRSGCDASLYAPAWISELRRLRAITDAANLTRMVLPEGEKLLVHLKSDDFDPDRMAKLAEDLAAVFPGRECVVVPPIIHLQPTGESAEDERAGKADQAAGRIRRWLIAHPARAAAARFPIDECWTLLDERSDRKNADTRTHDAESEPTR